jgi:hypothetical protein
MYINAQVYEELYLKGQPIEAVEREVSKMRAELERLKRKMESPEYRTSDYAKYPSEQESISATRQYLNAALLYLAEMKGDNSVLTEEERTAAVIRSLRMHIESITLAIGDSTYVIDMINAVVKVIRDGAVVETHEYNRHQLLSVITDLRIEEWREIYSPEDYGCTLAAPEYWSLEVNYGDATEPRMYRGEGVYPYNFNLLKRLLHIN